MSLVVPAALRTADLEPDYTALISAAVMAV